MLRNGDFYNGIHASIIRQFFVSTICVHCTCIHMFECECVKEKYGLGYYMIYSSETKGKAETHRQSWAERSDLTGGHTNNLVEKL
jgi:hypothetical protein